MISSFLSPQEITVVLHHYKRPKIEYYCHTYAGIARFSLIGLKFKIVYAAMLGKTYSPFCSLFLTDVRL